MVIETVPVSSLLDAPYNPMRSDERSESALQASMERFGLTEMIVWNRRTGNVVAGHRRKQILRRKKVKNTDVIVVDLSEDEEKALNVTMNNPELRGQFVSESLDNILKDLRASLDLVEFDALGLTDLAALYDFGTQGYNVPEFSVDALPEPKKKVKKKPAKKEDITTTTVVVTCDLDIADAVVRKIRKALKGLSVEIAQQH